MRGLSGTGPDPALPNPPRPLLGCRLGIEIGSNQEIDVESTLTLQSLFYFGKRARGPRKRRGLRLSRTRHFLGKESKNDKRGKDRKVRVVNGPETVHPHPLTPENALLGGGGLVGRRFAYQPFADSRESIRANRLAKKNLFWST